MSKQTSDKSLQLIASVQLAMSYFHTKQPEKALAHYERAIPLLARSSPLVQSNFFVKQAVAFAQYGKITEMHRGLEQASLRFPSQPDQDASALFTDFTASSLFSWKATALLQSVQQKKEGAFVLQHLLMQADQTPSKQSSKVSAYVHNLCAEATVVMNDLDWFTHSLPLGLREARQLKSARRLQETIVCYHLARKQWPQEEQVLRLAEHFIAQ